MTDINTLHQAAADADKAFHAELVRQHGDAARDNRYIPVLDDAGVKAARKVFMEACDAFKKASSWWK